VADGSLPSRKVGARVLVDMSAREARCSCRAILYQAPPVED
jgi:hypothetical protein